MIESGGQWKGKKEKKIGRVGVRRDIGGERA